jgi:leucyl-tRNA synthetase
MEEAQVRQQALACENVQRHLAGRRVERVIYVPGRLVNLVTSSISG